MIRSKGDRTRPIVDAPAPFPIASEGQITVAKALCQPLGWGSRVSGELGVDPIALRPWRPSSGHGLSTGDASLLRGSRPGEDG